MTPTTQLEHLKAKATPIARAIVMSPITRYGSKLAYNTTYTPSVKYALPQSFFQDTTLDKAQVRSMVVIKQKCGYAQSTPDAIIYGSVNYAGAGFIP